MSKTIHKLLTVGIVTTLLTSLIVLAGPTAAIEATATGPDEVTKPNSFTIGTSLDVPAGETVDVTGITVSIRPDGGTEETLELTFAPDGTIRSTTPERGVVGEGLLRVEQLRRTTTMAPVSDETGYGYGYGEPGGTSLGYEVTLNSTAFKHGSYDLWLTIHTEDTADAFRSNTISVDVLLPNGQLPASGNDERDGGPPEDRGRNHQLAATHGGAGPPTRTGGR